MHQLAHSVQRAFHAHTRKRWVKIYHFKIEDDKFLRPIEPGSRLQEVGDRREVRLGMSLAVHRLSFRSVEVKEAAERSPMSGANAAKRQRKSKRTINVPVPFSLLD